MIAAALSRWRRMRRIGIRVIAQKLSVRLWSTRVAVLVSRDTSTPARALARIPLSFSVVPSEQVDPSEFKTGARQGTDMLYIEGLVRMYRRGPGDAMVARASDGALVGVGLMSYADRHEVLDAAAPGLYHRLSSDECWTEAHYVLPEYRSLRALAGILAAERAYLQRRGVRKVFAVIDTTNVPSLRAFARSGHEPTGVIRLDRYRLNRYTSRFVVIDDRTLTRWQRAVDANGAGQ
jgi:hypothetical protein